MKKRAAVFCPGGDFPHRQQIYKFYFDSDGIAMQ